MGVFTVESHSSIGKMSISSEEPGCKKSAGSMCVAEPCDKASAVTVYIMFPFSLCHHSVSLSSSPQFAQKESKPQQLFKFWKCMVNCQFAFYKVVYLRILLGTQFLTKCSPLSQMQRKSRWSMGIARLINIKIETA